MAQYLIITDDGTIEVEGQNMQRAAEAAGLKEGETVMVYRIADGPKMIVTTVEKVRRFTITDPGEEVSP